MGSQGEGRTIKFLQTKLRSMALPSSTNFHDGQIWPLNRVTFRAQRVRVIPAEHTVTDLIFCQFDGFTAS